MATGTWGGLTDNNIFRVTCAWSQGSGICQTGFKLRDLAVQDNSSEDVANAVDAWFNGTFKTILMNSDKLLFVDVLKMGTTTGFKKLYNNVSGTRNPTITLWGPGFVSVEVALKNSNRARYGQGRMFWPVRGSDYYQFDALTATGIAAFQGIVDDLVDKFSGSVLTHDLVLVNAHGTIPARAASGSRPARPEIPPSWYDVETVHLNTAVTSLRSRKAGIGT